MPIEENAPPRNVSGVTTINGVTCSFWKSSAHSPTINPNSLKLTAVSTRKASIHGPEARRARKECVSQCRSLWSPYQQKTHPDYSYERTMRLTNSFIIHISTKDGLHIITK